MVNAIVQNKIDRRDYIVKIKGWISKVIKAKRKVNYKKLVLETRSKCNVSDRTAKEYIEVAFFELKLSQKKVCQ